MIIYPSESPSPQGTRLRVQSARRRAGAEIIALGLSIPGALDEVKRGAPRRGIPAPVTRALMETIEKIAGGAGNRLVAA